MMSTREQLLQILVFLSLSVKVVAILCYECTTETEDDCGPLFKENSFSPLNCSDTQVCGLQRQDAIPQRKQVAGIVRGCYTLGQIQGLNDSSGCRYWTNKKADFTALYCFCDTNLCNKASHLTTTPEQLYPWLWCGLYYVMLPTWMLLFNQQMPLYVFYNWIVTL